MFLLVAAAVDISYKPQFLLFVVNSILLMLYSASTEGLQQHLELLNLSYVHRELTLELKPKDK